MEDLNILKSGMEYLKKAMECFRQCDLVTDKEYYQISDLYYNTLTTRKIEKEIEVKSVRMEEI